MNQKTLERLAIFLMVFGIVSLCQPWIAVLHAWSVLIMLLGLIGFNVAAHMPVAETAKQPEVIPHG
ncbi:hypothetical protein [Devosia sp.]|uniref:hypothetical protein n=1 Tax=Devosia sp. TaxID=1871048 RepID=UPI003267A2A4